MIQGLRDTSALVSLYQMKPYMDFTLVKIFAVVRFPLINFFASDSLS